MTVSVLKTFSFAAPVATCALAAALVCAALPATAEPANNTWNFAVQLDGRTVGHHKFTLSGQGAERELRSDAGFDVKILGVSLYRYQHESVERWRGDCLANLDSKTDDNDKPVTVTARRVGDKLDVVSSKDGDKQLDGCVMTFAYWNPATLKQTRLLNPQNGRVETVNIVDAGDDTIEVRGKTVQAHQYRIEGPKQPIHVWYSARGDWLKLESAVAGGRKLTYRLQ